MSSREPPDPDDPIAYYIKHLERKGSAPRTISGYENSLSHLQTYISQRDLAPHEVTVTECIGFIKWAKSQWTDRTVTKYTGSINKFYQFFSNRGTFETNPMRIALDEVNLSPADNHHRRDVSLEEMREFICHLRDPQTLAMVVLLAKTGVRQGEAVNIDLSDLHLSHQRANEVLPKPRPEIRALPDSLFVSSEISEGDIVNGDRRDAGNKRHRDTIVPIDDDLKHVLLQQIATHPPSPDEAEPLFRIAKGTRTDRLMGQRATPASFTNRLRTITKEYGWYERGGGAENNVTAHYFRHWFTTMARDHGMSRSVVKYIRGDADRDMVDHYTHNWGNKARKDYLDNIYSLFSE